jgi:hypothetical protein
MKTLHEEIIMKGHRKQRLLDIKEMHIPLDKNWVVDMPYLLHKVISNKGFNECESIS